MKRAAKFLKIVDFLESAVFSVDCTVDFVCDQMEISRSTLHRIVKEGVGMSTTNYMNSLRLEKGYKLLLEGDKEIKNISLSIGFKDPKYFSKLFKRKFGITPDSILNGRS